MNGSRLRSARSSSVKRGLVVMKAPLSGPGRFGVVRKTPPLLRPLDHLDPGPACACGLHVAEELRLIRLDEFQRLLCHGIIARRDNCPASTQIPPAQLRVLAFVFGLCAAIDQS